MLLVQKFGGSSVASPSHIAEVAKKIQQVVNRGDQVVVVVSAMGDSTDHLVELAESLVAIPSGREMDALLSTGELVTTALLAMVLEQLEVPARSFSGAQAGIRTSYDFGRARIQSIDPTRLRKALAVGITPIVAGFQGVTEGGDVATLGRGGSDLTAIALAGALNADRCEIYSDVPGVFTADPRIVPDAVPLSRLSYDEMLELASQGAQVLQTQAVAYAKGNQVVIHARSTFQDEPGTQIEAESVVPVKPAVTAVAINRHVAKVGLLGVPDSPGVAALLFSALAEHGINIELVIQSVSHDKLNDIAFTIDEQDVARARPVVEQCLGMLQGQAVVIDDQVAKISAIGTGMLGQPGVAARVFQALADADINIQMIGTSEIKISCIVARQDAERGLAQIHTAFGLNGLVDVIEDSQ